jgi:hypothetical protein
MHREERYPKETLQLPFNKAGNKKRESYSESAAGDKAGNLIVELQKLWVI